MAPRRTGDELVPLSYGGFQVHQDVRHQSVIKGMIHGEIAGLLTAGWSPDEVHSVFGDHAILGRSEWPPSVRGLSLTRRKSLAQFGLHGLHTQLLLLISQVVPKAGREVGELQDALVSALDNNALRGVEHRILEVAHAHRRNEEPAPDGGRRALRGVSVSAAVYAAVTRELEEDAVHLASHISDTIYSDRISSTLTGVLTAVLHRQLRSNDSEDVLHICAPLQDFLKEHYGPDVAQSVLNLFRDSWGEASIASQISTILPGQNEYISSILAAVLIGVCWTGTSESALETILSWGGETAIMAAVANAFLGARLGTSGVVEGFMVDHTVTDRVLHHLEFGPTDIVFSDEVELTLQAQAWREGMIAERRTR